MKVNEMLRDILFKNCFIDILLRLKCRLNNYMRDKFIHVYSTLKLVVK